MRGIIWEDATLRARFSHDCVTGYFRPVRKFDGSSTFNKGKLSEWNDRKTYNVTDGQMSAPKTHKPKI